MRFFEEKRFTSAQIALAAAAPAAFLAGAAYALSVPGVAPGQVAKASDVQQIVAAVTALEAKLQYVSIVEGELDGLTGPHWILSGVNLHVESGAGSTDEENCNGGGPACTGLGNVIVGYNEPDASPDSGGRTGAHNLVVGSGHEYTRYGGLLGGRLNNVTSPYASATGGFFGTAGGDYASVTGGYGNTAGSDYASVTGGYGNTAGGYSASVTGGYGNTAGGYSASVTGGYSNTAGGYSASVTGGTFNDAAGDWSVVVGGGQNVLGCAGNTASGEGSVVVGGACNSAVGDHTVILAGKGKSLASSFFWRALRLYGNATDGSDVPAY